MNEQPTILESTPATDEQKRLVTIFTDIESKQIEFLDESGKRLIELTTALLGVVFAVTAFGDKFPPPYLKATYVKYLAVVTLALYVGAMLMAMRTVQPRSYDLYRHNLSEMRNVFTEIINHKSRSLKVAGILFWLGSVALATLVGSIIFMA